MVVREVAEELRRRAELYRKAARLILPFAPDDRTGVVDRSVCHQIRLFREVVRHRHIAPCVKQHTIHPRKSVVQ